jgi:hypothetical protein
VEGWGWGKFKSWKGSLRGVEVGGGVGEGLCIQNIDTVEFLLQQSADLVQYGEHCYTSMAKKLAGHVESFNMDDLEVELEAAQEGGRG